MTRSVDSSAGATDRTCAWCLDPIPTISSTGRSRRADSIYCGKPCRQAAHRARSSLYAVEAAAHPMRFAYADPPYLGKSELYVGHPDYQWIVDYKALVDQLVDEYPDGWAMSASAESLQYLLGLCPPDVRVAAWVRGGGACSRAHGPINSWEPIIYRGGRADVAGTIGRRLDSLVHGVTTRSTDPLHVIGAKPFEVLSWMFSLLGLQPGDELDDLFPGSGGVGRLHSLFNGGLPEPSRSAAARHDTSRSTAVRHDTSVEVLDDGYELAHAVGE